MTDADKILNEMSKVRLKEQQHQKYDLDYQSKGEYASYYAWCRANDYDCNDSNFKIYVKKEHKDISFWIKKRIFELYFNYEFVFDYDKGCWSSIKKAI